MAKQVIDTMMVVSRRSNSRSFVEEISEPDSPQVTDEILCRRIAALSRQKPLPEEAKNRILAALRPTPIVTAPATQDNPPPCVK